MIWLVYTTGAIATAVFLWRMNSNTVDHPVLWFAVVFLALLWPFTWLCLILMVGFYCGLNWLADLMERRA